MQPLSGNQRPDLLTALMNMSLVLCLPRKMHLNPHVLLTVDKVHNPLRLPRETTSELPKVVRTFSVFNMLTSKCASRHNRVHFFDISTSKSALSLSVFYTFDFEMCFAPQRRATFHLSSGRMARSRRFSEPTFRPSGATNHWKNAVFRAFLTFSRTWIFFLRRLSHFYLLSSSLLFSDSSHFCFSSVHIVGSLTSKTSFDYYI